MVGFLSAYFSYRRSLGIQTGSAGVWHGFREPHSVIMRNSAPAFFFGVGLVFLGPKVQAPDPCLEGAGSSSDDTPVVCGRALSHAVLWLSIPISVRPKPEAQVKNPKPKTPQTLSTRPQQAKQKKRL